MSVKRARSVEPNPARFKRITEVAEARALQRKALRRIDQLRAAVANPMSFTEDISGVLDEVWHVCDSLADMLFDPDWGKDRIILIPPEWFERKKEAPKPEA